jgi:chorismate dehydratase
MTASTSAGSVQTAAEPIQLGVVSFLNTLPLIDGLDRLEGFRFRYSVPSLLIDQLLAREVDLALCSSIDYQRSPEPLLIVPVGALGCDGATLTVRLYSQQPIERIQHVYCDRDSHTSIALLRILLREMHQIDPVLIEYDAREHVAENHPIDWPDTMLLIGDKVVTDSPPAVRYPYQLDLGAAWLELTGLPFVFAVWMARKQRDLQRIRTAAAVLDRQRRHNIERLDLIVHRRAEPRRWPPDLARIYLTQRLVYEFTPRLRDGLELFFAKAQSHGLITRRRPIELLTDH